MKIVTKEELCGYLPFELKCQYVGIINGSEISKHLREYNKENDTLAKWERYVPIEEIKGFKVAPLKTIRVYKKYWVATCGIYNNGQKAFTNGAGMKPIMHPLSSLTKPVLEGGKIPMEVLLDIESGSNWSNSDYLITEKGVGEWWTRIKDSDTVFGYNQDNGFYMMVSFNFKFVKNQLQLFQKLYQWHFWLGDQSYFESGVIIDKSTLK